MYKGTFLEYLVDKMDISTVKEHYAEFSNGGDFTAYVKELTASRASQSAVPSEETIKAIATELVVGKLASEMIDFDTYPDLRYRRDIERNIEVINRHFRRGIADNAR